VNGTKNTLINSHCIARRMITSVGCILRWTCVQSFLYFLRNASSLLIYYVSAGVVSLPLVLCCDVYVVLSDVTT